MAELESNSSPRFDLLLKGGRVLDPAAGLDGTLDVAVRAGLVAAVAPDLPASAADLVVDVSGLLVTPGLIDLHAHIYPFRPIPQSYVECVQPDAHLLASGVTTAVDAGTAGWADFEDFKSSMIDRATVRVLAFVNIARAGMVDCTTEQDPAEFNPARAAEVARAFPGLVVGIKSAHYWTKLPWDDYHQPWASVEQAVSAGEDCGLPIMVDFWPRPPRRSYQELILKYLRPGDIHTHVFAQQFPILNSDGRVSDFLFAARERGVLFDLGHGAASFWFRNAVPAYRQGFPPDTISTDLHMANINGPVLSLQHTLNKFLNLGMPLPEVIERATLRPARVLRRPDLGTLAPGAPADLAIFELRQGRFGFADCGKARLVGDQKLECRLTLRAGKIVFDPSGLSMPDWEHAPAPYWVIPELQS